MYVIKKVMGFMFQVIFLNPYCTFYGFLNSFHSKSCLSGITDDMYATTVFLYFLLQWIIRFVAHGNDHAVKSFQMLQCRRNSPMELP